MACLTNWFFLSSAITTTLFVLLTATFLSHPSCSDSTNLDSVSAFLLDKGEFFARKRHYIYTDYSQRVERQGTNYQFHSEGLTT